jgi:hypothetical protein
MLEKRRGEMPGLKKIAELKASFQVSREHGE